MRLNCQIAKGIAGVLALAAALISPFDTLAQGDLFDFLFGPDTPSAFPSGRTWRVTHPHPRPRASRGSIRHERPASVHAETDSMSGGGYCVRACDGYYFPLIKSSLISGQQSCEFACPSARVQLYEGENIEEARNAKGERYAALPTAYSFRDRLAAGCSCIDPAASHDYFRRLSRRDPTLQAGDVIISENGALVYTGSELVSVDRASRHIRARLRELLPRKFAPRNANISLSEKNASH